MLIEYVRKGNRKVGVVVAVGPKNIGYSLCNVNGGDCFNPERGKEIAIGRAVKNPISASSEIPHSIIPAIINMHERANRYFKENSQV